MSLELDLERSMSIFQLAKVKVIPGRRHRTRIYRDNCDVRNRRLGKAMTGDADEPMGIAQIRKIMLWSLGSIL